MTSDNAKSRRAFLWCRLNTNRLQDITHLHINRSIIGRKTRLSVGRKRIAGLHIARREALFEPILPLR